MKPGYKTTEFWLSLAAIFVGALMSSGVFDSLPADHAMIKIVGIIASVLGALGYTAARGFTKVGEAKAAALGEAVKANPPLPPQP